MAYHYTTPDTLDKMADVVEQGWCRFDYHKKGNRSVRSASKADRHCVWGASEVVGTKSQDWYEAARQQIQSDGYSMDPVTYNDHQRDKRKVVRMLRRTARNLRNKTGPFAS